MKIGVCGGFDRIAKAAEFGFDYIEANFSSLTASDSAAYCAFNEELIKYGITCEAANCFLPGNMRITGKSIDYNALENYLKKGFTRAEETGIKVVVMGSSGARNLDAETSYSEGIQQIIYFVKNFVSPLADEHKIDFVFEPLCKRESNIINTIKEGAMLASAIARPNVGTLADLYHMYVEGDTYEDIRDLKGMLRHSHMSNPASDNSDAKRIFMKTTDDFDYKGFFDALKYAGCERVSIEAHTDDFAADIVEAVKVMNLYK